MIRIGDTVNYHSIIGGEVTSRGHNVYDIEHTPNNYGCTVAFITDHSGCVSIAALSNSDNPMKPAPKPLTRSQQRYRDWQTSECSIDFGECFGECKKCRDEREQERADREWYKDHEDAA